MAGDVEASKAELAASAEKLAVAEKRAKVAADV